MAWRPAADELYQGVEQSPFWLALSQVFDSACPLSPLPRRNWDALRSAYTIEREGYGTLGAKESTTGLPRLLRDMPLGRTGAQLLKKLLLVESDRVVALIGPRGAGKTSLIHYVEACTRASGYSQYPVFLIVDGLALPERPGILDYVDLLIQEMDQEALEQPPAFQAALASGVDALRSERSFAGVRRSFAAVLSALPQRQRRRVVLVIDNLDHLDSRYVRTALDIARQVYVSCGVACVVCLRPGCLSQVVRGGDAHAFFQYPIPVYAPDVERWLVRLGDRLAEAARNLEAETGTIPVAYGVEITPDRLSAAFARLVTLLRGRVPQDDVIPLLQAVSADDTRHLVSLVKQLIQHREFPGEYLLGLAPKPAFHPLTSLFEGGHRLYKRNDFVPNLLCYEPEEGNPDFLVFQRLLVFLNERSYEMPAARLIGLMDLLGYPEGTVRDCLRILLKALLVRSTDTEFINHESEMPSGLYLTAAGRRYLRDLLKNADYLTAVVMDVPLRHTAVKREGRSSEGGVAFANRLTSLVEYLAEVQRRENAQIRRLRTTKAGPRLRAVVDILWKDGLFSGFLLEGLRAAADRGWYSKSASVHAESRRLREQIGEVEKWLVRRKKVLADLLNRARKVRAVAVEPLLVEGPGQKVMIRGRQVGDELRMTAEIEGEGREGQTAVGLLGRLEGSGFAQASIAQASGPGGLAGEEENDRGRGLVAKFLEVSNPAHVAGKAVRSQTVWCPPGAGRVGLLSPNVRGDELELVLYVPGEIEMKPRALGATIGVSQVRSLAESLRDQVSNLLVSGRFSREKLQVIGATLTRHLLGEIGRNTLSAYTNLLDTLLVFIGVSDLGVPWEWLTLEPAEAWADPPLVCEKWRVVRWGADVLSGVMRLHIAGREASLGQCRAVGLPSDPDCPWRRPNPGDAKGLREMARESTTLHVAGHVDESGAIGLGDQLDLTADLVRTFPLLGPTSIVLSACSTGNSSGPGVESLAAVIASNSGAVTWAPLVNITDENATRVDLMLGRATALAEPATVEEILRPRAEADPLLAVYARYGVHEEGGKYDDRDKTKPKRR